MGKSQKTIEKKSFISRYKSIVVLILLLIAGFIFRFVLSGLYPHLPLFDESEYLLYAEKMRTGFWWANCCYRTYMYPAFINGVFSLFGEGNLFALRVVQCFVDTLTALVLFLTSLRLFKKRNYAWAVFLLYLFNPMTASFTGLFLTEVLSIFLFSLTLYLVVLYSEGKKVAFFLGLSLGLLTYTRMVFWWWMLAILLFLFVRGIRNRNIKNFLLIVLGVGITMVYAVGANWHQYKKVSPMPVFPSFTVDYIVSQRVTFWPAILTEWDQEKIEYINQTTDKLYGSAPYEREYFLNNLKPELSKALYDELSNPAKYIPLRLNNVVNLWNKSNLYYYWDPFYPGDKIIIRTLNIIFLSLSLVGVFALFKKKSRSNSENTILLFVLFTVFFFIVPISLSVPEERHTLTIYPLLLMFVPLGYDYLVRFIKRNRSN